MATKEELELRKLEAEIDEIVARTPTPHTRDLELQLLQHQVKTGAKQANPTWGMTLKEWVVLLASFIPLAAVIVGFLTLWHNQGKDARQFETTQRASIARYGEGLSHQNAATRIANVNGLAAHMSDPPYADLVATILVGAALQEPELAVRGAIARALALDPSRALAKWDEALPYARASLAELRDRSNALERRLYNLRRAGADLQAAQGQLDQLGTRIGALQHAAISLAAVTRPGLAGTPARCARIAGCAQCRMDLSDLALDDFEFATAGTVLCNADFSGSSLVSANFTGRDLTGANFSGADLREASFVDARLAAADLGAANIAWQADGTAHRPPADFKGADLTGANLEAACLSGADFRGAAWDPPPAQVAPAYAFGARFDTDDLERLQQAGAIREGPGCQKPH